MILLHWLARPPRLKADYVAQYSWHHQMQIILILRSLSRWDHCHAEVREMRLCIRRQLQ